MRVIRSRTGSHQPNRLLAGVALAMALIGCDGDRSVPGPVASRDLVGPAAPNPPIIRLHYDYMVAPDHSHAPSANAIQLVVDAFRMKGIELRVDPLHAAIPERRYVGIDGTCGSTVDNVSVQDLRNQYFQPRGPGPWHYAVFAHHLAHRGYCGAGGVAEFPGYNLVVAQSVAWLVDLPGQVPPEFIPFIDGGTLMHELGHNLGLHHGGDEEESFKPNYLSVMGTYTFGITSAATPGLTDATSRRLDYSDRTLPPLDERHLDERAGVQAGTTDIVHYLCLPPDETEPVERLGPGTGPIDWNCDGVIEADVSSDLNWWAPPGLSNDPLRVLTGYNDWAHIHALLRTPAYITGTLLRRGIVS